MKTKSTTQKKIEDGKIEGNVKLKNEEDERRCK
jgi:hypothetical protein